MQPTVGRIVQYQLNAADADAINRRRTDFDAFRRGNPSPLPSAPGSHYATGHVGHTGNQAAEGDVCAAVVVRTFGEVSTANLQVLLDGNDTYWATSCREGDEPGTWAWPARS